MSASSRPHTRSRPGGHVGQCSRWCCRGEDRHRHGLSRRTPQRASPVSVFCFRFVVLWKRPQNRNDRHSSVPVGDSKTRATSPTRKRCADEGASLGSSHGRCAMPALSLSRFFPTAPWAHLIKKGECMSSQFWGAYFFVQLIKKNEYNSRVSVCWVKTERKGPVFEQSDPKEMTRCWL